MLVGIVTIIDRNNYGNRLQNYALYYYCKNKLGTRVYTFDNHPYFNNKNRLLYKKIRSMIKSKFKREAVENEAINIGRKRNFLEFDRNIEYYKKKIDAHSKLKEFDYIIVGSDQVWNPYFDRLSDVDVLKEIDKNKRISYAASFGVDCILDPHNIIEGIADFKAISVREDRGKEIIESITDRKDVEVLIDPTMLLSPEEWDKVSLRPQQLDNLNGKKYILNCFLGNLSSDRYKEIRRIADENNCEIINLLDPNSPFYECGPSEFLYLEKHAFLICTDSFHSAIFSIIYNRPFIVFNREQAGVVNMNSRISTLINKFNLSCIEFNGNRINLNNLNIDYDKVNKILESEKMKSKLFLERALNRGKV